MPDRFRYRNTMANPEERRPSVPVIRRDRYTILVDGHPIRATEDQERRIRAMDADERARFLRVMGAGS